MAKITEIGWEEFSALPLAEKKIYFEILTATECRIIRFLPSSLTADFLSGFVFSPTASASSTSRRRVRFT
jgi:hypothetical protein